MRENRFEYRRLTFEKPPTADELEKSTQKGWELVSVTVEARADEPKPFYLAYLKRPSTVSKTIASELTNGPRVAHHQVSREPAAAKEIRHENGRERAKVVALH